VQREQVASKLSELAFDFFFWFSRFEFALKESNYLQSHKIGATADPGWREFMDKHEADYTPSPEARRLIELSPKQQVVGTGGTLKWDVFPFPADATDLQRVVQLLKIVRNNLFHGGKHGAEGWDDPPRTEELLRVGRSVFDQLSSTGHFEADYRRYY
jgi:hypothetical protein